MDFWVSKLCLIILGETKEKCANEFVIRATVLNLCAVALKGTIGQFQSYWKKNGKKWIYKNVTHFAFSCPV